jgi:hypothetical protein
MMARSRRKNGNKGLFVGVIALLTIFAALLFIIARLAGKINGENPLDPTKSPEKQAEVTGAVATKGADKDNKPTDTANAGDATKAPEATKPVNVATATPVPQPTETPTPTPEPDDVSFSLTEHFYDHDVVLELTDTTGKNGTIVYTTDGTTPKKNGTKYSGPISLAADDDDFPNCYCIRAKAFYSDGTESAEFSHSYFVNTKIKDRFTTIVFSISGDPAELTDGPNGILYGENYKQRGSDSERAIHVEAFDPDGNEYFSQFAGARVYGGTSRQHAVKSLKLYAKKKYDPEHGKFELDVFNTPDAEGDIIKKYDRMVLRNGGDDFQGAFLREELMQILAAQAGLPFTENAVPAVAYLNGEYYGYYWLHENYCDDFFQKVCGKADGEYYVFESTEKSLSGGNDKLQSTLAYEYNSFYKKFSTADLTDDANFNEMQKTIDIYNYLDYMAFNVYLDNYDWPQGNVKVMRYYSESGEYEPGTYRDGRFWFLVHDSDIGTGCYGKGDICDADRDDITRVLTLSNSHSSALLKQLLKRDDCRKYFIGMLRFLGEEIFTLENVNLKLAALLDLRDGEMGYYITHLRSLKDAGIWCTVNSVVNDVETIRTFVSKRLGYINKYIDKNWPGE